MRIGLLSDTHGHLDSSIFRYLETCDEIWHAGDIGSIDIADSLADRIRNHNRPVVGSEI